MSYLKSFQERIASHDYPSFLKLWEEYCYSDEIDPVELRDVLLKIKNSELKVQFGQHVEKILPLWEKIEDKDQKHFILKLIADLEATNSETLADVIIRHIKNRYNDDSLLEEKLRIIGLRTKENFQGAISNYELLTHMGKGKFVFHTGGWGAGEILDFSLLREELTIEFDYVVGPRHFSFTNAFKTLIPLSEEHFLARRFGNPDLLEKEAKENPIAVIHLLLKDLGPKTAAEIKSELSDLVIPEKEWIRWWQTVRGKLKKDPKIEFPKESSGSFRLLEEEISPETSFHLALESKPGIDETIHIVFNFLKDFPSSLKNEEFKESLRNRLQDTLKASYLTEGQKLELALILEDIDKKGEELAISIISKSENLPSIIEKMELSTLKKKAFALIKKERKDWEEIFLNLMLTVDQNFLRDYLLLEIKSPKLLEEKIKELLASPEKCPQAFAWYFQRVILENSLPFSDKRGRSKFFEGYLTLLNKLEQDSDWKDFVKKQVNFLSNERYKVIRQIMENSSLEEAKEFILLASKSQVLNASIAKIISSLAEVAHPSLASKEGLEGQEEMIWTTKEGYIKAQKHLKQLATVETIQNAKEIEEARSHGDLRENAEYKAALEKRARIQGDIKDLSDLLNKAKIITMNDIARDEVGVGACVTCVNSKGETHKFTLLGPWDTDPEKGIISYKSKLAQSMKGGKVGSTFQFQGEEYKIVAIETLSLN